MEDKIFIAIIAASSALLGSLIPTVVNYLNSREKRQKGSKRGQVITITAAKGVR